MSTLGHPDGLRSIHVQSQNYIPDPLEDNPYDLDRWDVDDSDEEHGA